VYEWRNAFGSSAVTTLKEFFDADKDNYDTDAKRVAYAEFMLNDLRFTFQDTESEDPKVQIFLSAPALTDMPMQQWRGLFRSDFIVRVFANHLSAIQGSKDLPALDTTSPSAALALSAAAVSVPLSLNPKLDINALVG
jgi:hypothetical protein